MSLTEGTPKPQQMPPYIVSRSRQLAENLAARFTRPKTILLAFRDEAGRRSPPGRLGQSLARQALKPRIARTSCAASQAEAAGIRFAHAAGWEIRAVLRLRPATSNAGPSRRRFTHSSPPTWKASSRRLASSTIEAYRDTSSASCELTCNAAFTPTAFFAHDARRAGRSCS
jgi:hypothetical protein